MGKLIFSMITSLDGYISDRAGDFTWGVPDEEVLEVINEQTRAFGTCLYGRRMYELMAVWETDPEAAGQSPRSAEFAKIWTAAEKIVFSTTLSRESTSRTRLEREFVPADIARLKASSSADLSVDGPTLAAHALRHGLVDELHLLISPIVLGGGQPMLPDLRFGLELLDERRFSNGMVQLRYALKGS